MNAALAKALVASLPAGALLLGALVLFFRSTARWALVQLLGAACLNMVVLLHVFEALHLFPSMGWGLADSAGHYVDLAGAALGLTLFPAGYFLYAVGKWVS